MPTPNLWRFTPRFHGLSACYGHVAHALRTLAPVADKSIATLSLPLDLHVLSLPLAFILSQDQTLHCTSFILYSSSTILTSSFLKRNLRSNVFRVALYISYFLQVCCLSLSLFQSTVVRFPNGIAKVRLFSFIPNPNQKFLHFFWNYFSPQQSPQRNSLKNSALSQISTEGNFFINFYSLNNFVTKSANKRKSQQVQIATSADQTRLCIPTKRCRPTRACTAAVLE